MIDRDNFLHALFLDVVCATEGDIDDPSLVQYLPVHVQMSAPFTQHPGRTLPAWLRSPLSIHQCFNIATVIGIAVFRLPISVGGGTEVDVMTEYTTYAFVKIGLTWFIYLILLTIYIVPSFLLTEF